MREKDVRGEVSSAFYLSCRIREMASEEPETVKGDARGGLSRFERLIRGEQARHIEKRAYPARKAPRL